MDEKFCQEISILMNNQIEILEVKNSICQVKIEWKV